MDNRNPSPRKIGPGAALAGAFDKRPTACAADQSLVAKEPRQPEIGDLLECQEGLLKELYEKFTVLEERLSQICKAEIGSDDSSRCFREPDSKVGSILAEHCRNMAGLVERIEDLYKRLEI